MVTFQVLRNIGLVGVGLCLTACDEGLEVRFEQPFPAQVADMAEFPGRHRAVYTAADSTRSLCVGRTAVWRQDLQTTMRSRQQLDSLHRPLRADTTYAEPDGTLHYLKLVGRDSVRDSYLRTDTLFTLAGPEAGRLRGYQGRYYLNTPNVDDHDKWNVQRLEIDGRRLRWESFTTDTLRLLVLDPATVRYHREHGRLTSFRLTPEPGAQTRRVGRYAGLWETKGEFNRRH